MPSSPTQPTQMRLGRTRSLHIRTLLILMVLGILIPFVIANTFFAFTQAKDEQKRINELNLLNARNMSLALDGQFHVVETALVGLRNGFQLGQDSLQSLYKQATEVEKNHGLHGVVLSDSEGQLLFATNRPFGEKLPKIKGGGSREVFEERRSYVTNFFMGPVTQDWLVAVRVPVFDRKGNVIYSLSGTYSAKELNQFLAKYALQGGQIITLFDSTGRVGGRTKAPDGIVGTMIRPQFKEKLDSESTGFFIGLNRTNTPISAAYHQSQWTKWTISLATPLADISLQEWEKVRLILLLSGLVLLLGLLLGVGIGGAVTRAVKGLIPRAQSLGAGRPVETLVSPIVEINEVGGALVEASRQLNEAKHHACHDSLTGLPNRAMIDLNLPQQMALSDREDYSILLLFLDLDGFKNINDTYGHEIGDALLKDVSRRLVETVRKSDIVARFGGDEFAVLLIDANKKLGLILANKILDAVAGKPFNFGNISLTITCSIGVAGYPSCADNQNDLFSRADKALYVAKNSGRNQVSESPNLV